MRVGLQLKVILYSAIIPFLFFSIFSCFSFAENLKGSEWAQFKGNSGFTGVSTEEVKPPLKLLWSTTIGADGSGDTGGGCTIAGGRVFVVMESARTLMALDAATGARLWLYRQPHISLSVASSSGDLVYLWMRRSTIHYVVALDAATGKEVWKVSLEKQGLQLTGQRGGPALSNGKVFCVSGGEKPAVVALNAKTGEEIWRGSINLPEGQTIGTPCVAGGKVFIGTAAIRTKEIIGTIAALEEETGNQLWRRDDVGTTKAPSSDGEVIAITASNGSAFLLNAQTGETIWGGIAGAGYCSSLTLTKDFVMGKAYGSYFNAYDRKTGQQVWDFREKATSGCGTPTISGKYAYFGTGAPGVGGAAFALHFENAVANGRGTNLFAIDLDTKQPVWSFMTGFNICAEPSIAYGRVYAVSRDGRVYCFGPAKEGEPTTPEARDTTPNASIEEMQKLLAPELADKPQAGQDWPIDGGTPARAGIVTSGLKAPLELAWKIEAGGAVQASAVIRDGKVFVGSDSGKMLAIDAASGKIIWEAKTEGAVRCTPAAASDMVYCGDESGRFYGWDIATGSQKWSFEAGGPVQASPAVVGGMVIFGANDHNLYALNRTTGKKLWNFRGIGYQVASPPVIKDDTVYYVEGIYWIHALDLKNGQEQWRTFFHKRLDGISLYKDLLWVNGNHLAAIDPKNGKIVINANGASNGRPGFANDNMLLVPMIYDLTATDFKPGFELGLPRQKVKSHLKNTLRWALLGQPLMLDDGYIFSNWINEQLGSRGEVVMTKEDGTILWSYAFDSSCTASPIAANGLMVIGAHDGFVYGFKNKQ